MANFVKVGKVSDIKDKQMKSFQISGKTILISRFGGKFYATDEKCTHVGGPLSNGKLSDNIITCPWHGSKFDIKTGSVVEGPAKTPLKTFEVKVEGEDLLVNLQ
jgi:Ferredoxin subunits of nitrite reductase and ring-hydroxylating dioxygenases